MFVFVKEQHGYHLRHPTPNLFVPCTASTFHTSDGSRWYSAIRLFRNQLTNQCPTTMCYFIIRLVRISHGQTRSTPPTIYPIHINKPGEPWTIWSYGIESNRIKSVPRWLCAWSIFQAGSDRASRRALRRLPSNHRHQVLQRPGQFPFIFTTAFTSSW